MNNNTRGFTLQQYNFTVLLYLLVLYSLYVIEDTAYKDRKRSVVTVN